MTSNKLNYLLFILLACLWSGSFVAIKMVVGVVPPLFGAMLRVGTALICLLIILNAGKKDRAVDFAVRWKLWILGLFSQGLPFFFLFWGEQTITPGLAGILNGTVSLWAFVMGLVFMRAQTDVNPSKIFGLLIGIAGVILIFSPMITSPGFHNSLMGALSVLMMAVSYAIGALMNQQFFRNKIRVEFLANVYHQHCASLVFLFLSSLILEKWPSTHVLSSSISLWGATLYMGIFSTAIAWIIYYYLIREWDAVRASTVMYVVPLLSLVWDFLFFHNKPYLFEGLGCIIVLSGVVLVQFSSYKKRSNLPPKLN